MVNSHNKIVIGLAFIALLILIITIFLSQKSKPLRTDTQSQTVRSVDSNILVREDSWQIKAKDSKVTIVEFIDLESGSCRSTFPIFQQLIKDYEGRVNFVVRYFPSGNNSVLAAKAAESAGEQGKYWEMLDILFGKQIEWYERSEPQTELFIGYAKELHIDIEKFKKGLDKKVYEDKITRDKSDGISAGVNEIPLIFFNGKLAGNILTYDEFKSIIDPELAKN